MNLQKILKVKSFSKRLELILQEIRSAQANEQEDLLNALREVVKNSGDYMTLLALCIKFKHKDLDEVISLAMSKIDHPIYYPEMVGFLVLSGKAEQAAALIDSHYSDFNDLRKLQAAYYLARFGSRDSLYERLINDITDPDLKKEKSRVLKDPPTPPTSSSDFRFFLDDDESDFDWFGFAK